MTPEDLAHINEWLITLREGGALLVMAIGMIMLVRGDLIPKAAVDNMIPKIVAQTIALIKPEIAAEVENQMDKLGDKIVSKVTEKVDNNRRAGW